MFGLVSHVAPLDELQTEADALVADMLRMSPLGLRLTKDARGLSLDAGGMEAVIAMEDHNQVLCARSPTTSAKPRPPSLRSARRSTVTADAGAPFGRLSVPQDVASLVLYLVSGANFYINGRNVAVDGGG